MIELETVTACPACGAEPSDSWVPAVDRLYGIDTKGMCHARCLRCRVVFLMRRPVAEAMGAFYTDDYEPYEGAATELPAELHDEAPSRIPAAGQARWLELVRPVYRPVPNGGRLLDFGCGSPSFLKNVTRLGWEGIGTDFSDGVVARVRAAGFSACRIDELPRVVEAGSLDRIRMNHVLEHLYEPRETLSRLRILLGNGGLLHLAVPNPAGVTARLSGRYWWSLEPRHVVLYPPRALVALVAAAGYRVVGVAHQPSARDVRRSTEFALEGLHAPRRVRGALASRQAERVYALLAAAAAAVGRGDRLHLVARA